MVGILDQDEGRMSIACLPVEAFCFTFLHRCWYLTPFHLIAYNKSFDLYCYRYNEHIFLCFICIQFEKIMCGILTRGAN